jgi:hypothetical protein
MSTDLNHINDGGSNEKKVALQQLNEDLLAEDAFAENDFAEDAAEGLTKLNPAKTDAIVKQLNANLTAQLTKKKRKHKEIPDQSGMYIIILTLLVLIVVAFILIRKLYA